MVISNYGRSGLTLRMVDNAVNSPQFMAIGSGSGAELASLGSLIAEVFASRTSPTSTGSGTANKINWVFDFSAGTMSGVQLREFGIAGSQAKGTNDLWDREVIAGNGIEFDGTNELQIDITFEIF